MKLSVKEIKNIQEIHMMAAGAIAAMEGDLKPEQLDKEDFGELINKCFTKQLREMLTVEEMIVFTMSAVRMKEHLKRNEDMEIKGIEAPVLKALTERLILPMGATLDFAQDICNDIEKCGSQEEADSITTRWSHKVAKAHFCKEMFELLDSTMAKLFKAGEMA